MPAVDDIPVAHTPEGGWRGEMPPPVLDGCTEPLQPGAPALHGIWRVEAIEVNGAPVPEGHRAYGMLQRIEQAGDRMVVTGAGVIHDMRCDGTAENGVSDVAERDFRTKITVVATYEDGVHVLRPVGIPIEVTRRLQGEEIVWDYPGFIARLRRVESAD